MPEEQEVPQGGEPQGGEPLTEGPAPTTPPEPSPNPDPMAGTGQAAAPPAMKNKTIPLEVAKLRQDARKAKVKKNSEVAGIPKDLAPRWEIIVDESAKRIKAKRDTIKIAIGERPYQGIPVTEEEAEIRYLQIRDNVKLQTSSLEENITKSVDGRLLINKEYVKALIKMEKKLREGKSSV